MRAFCVVEGSPLSRPRQRQISNLNCPRWTHDWGQFSTAPPSFSPFLGGVFSTATTLLPVRADPSLSTLYQGDRIPAYPLVSPSSGSVGLVPPRSENPRVGGSIPPLATTCRLTSKPARRAQLIPYHVPRPAPCCSMCPARVSAFKWSFIVLRLAPVTVATPATVTRPCSRHSSRI